MKTTARVLMVAGSLLALVALPAAAELFTIELTNGHSFETRYRPKLDPRDPDKVYFLTDQGNWIAMAKNLVNDVVSQTEARGFGKVIDTTTIDLGWAPNDTPVPDGEGGVSNNPQADLVNAIRSQQPAPISTQQFVNPGQAGRSGGGLPASSVFP